MNIELVDGRRYITDKGRSVGPMKEAKDVPGIFTAAGESRIWRRDGKSMLMVDGCHENIVADIGTEPPVTIETPESPFILVKKLREGPCGILDIGDSDLEGYIHIQVNQYADANQLRHAAEVMLQLAIWLEQE